MDVSTSGFYHWLTRPQSATSARHEALLGRIPHYFEESDGSYGYRRIHADLAAEQTKCSPELVRQIMLQEGLVACQPRPFRITTEADAVAAANMPVLVKRDFTANRPGVKFVGGHHLHPHLAGIRLPGHRYRLLLQEGCRVVDRRPHAHRAGR
jgi:putative transposase